MANKTLGSILIVAGTAIGAGMLATPIITAASGFAPAAFLMFALWALMCISGLLTAEAALAFPIGHNGFHTMSLRTLGRGGQIFCWLAFLGLLYALTAAYISGGGSILSTTLQTFYQYNLPQWASCIIFLVVFGNFIYFGARSVDMLNRFLISIKGVFFIITMTLVTPYIHLENLFNQNTDGLFLLAAVPILITSFGFHVVVPSLVSYTENNVRSIVIAIVVGSFIPLVIYLVWLAGVLGIVPLVGDMSFIQILQDSTTHHKDEVGILLITLSDIVNHKGIAASMNFFSHLAITTSFLGVGLALFDFLLDTRKERNTSTRLQMIMVTFLPPLFFALYYPQGFRQALSFAGIFVALTCLILPALFAWRVRKSSKLNSPFKVPGGIWVILIVILCGLSVVVLELLNQFKCLPTLHALIPLQ